MNKPLFSPGPWETDIDCFRRGNHTSATVYVNHGFSKGSEICSFCDADLDCLDSETRANASLIAAAPELYTALKAILVGLSGQSMEEDTRRLLAAAHCALDKAEKIN